MSHLLEKLQEKSNTLHDDLWAAKKLCRHLHDANQHHTSDEMQYALDNAQQQIHKLKEEINHFIEHHEQEMAQKNEEITNLKQQLNQQINQQHQNKPRPKPQNIQGTPLLCYGQESDLYEHEILSFMHKALLYILQNQTHKNSRYEHIIQDIINANPLPRNFRTEKESNLQQTMRTYSRMDKPTRQALMDIGFDISEDGRHYKLVFMGDGRYTGVTSKTSSDNRAGKNFAHDLSNKLF